MAAFVGNAGGGGGGGGGGAPATTTTARTSATGLRTHNCGELRLAHAGQTVTLSGWVQQSRNMNHFAFVDLRDRYGITQCVFNKPGGEAEDRAAGAAADEAAAMLARFEQAVKLGREFVVRVTGTVAERAAKNADRATGDVEVVATALEVLNESKTPPFLIQDETDAAEKTRMQFRYLDIRRNPVKEALILRNKVCQIIRLALGARDFVEIETPVLIKSTPEGARDFVVPSRMNPGQFYALPQSPQTFKQILMVAGMDRYFQIVKCFRDEELRADRQPEFTQIDCEMSFVTQDDVLATFEGMIRRVWREVVGHEFPPGPFERMDYATAMREYGSDKPDLRFGMKLVELTDVVRAQPGFKVFDEAELVVGICCDGELQDFPELQALEARCAKAKKPKKPKAKELEKLRLKNWSKKGIKNLVKLATSEQVGAGGMVWVKCLAKGEFDSSAKKFYSKEQFAVWAEAFGAKEGDLLCVFSGPANDSTREVAGNFRRLMGERLGLRRHDAAGGYHAHWVVDFPLLEWNADEGRYTAMHHPFTSPKEEDFHLIDGADLTTRSDNVDRMRANAYDMVINGTEVGGGSIRIHARDLQMKVFQLLGFSQEAAQEQFGFLLGAFEYGAPPHGGLAFGLDRVCTLLGHRATIRDFIAFPKNNQGRDMMINSPSAIAPKQLEELQIASTVPKADEGGELAEQMGAMAVAEK